MFVLVQSLWNWDLKKSSEIFSDVQVFFESPGTPRINISHVRVRAVVKGGYPSHLLHLSMLDWPLMLRMNLPVVNTIHP